MDDVPVIENEIGRCLRIIECSEDDEVVLNDVIQDAAYDLWQIAREDIYDHWTFETDPANLQPSVRPLNRRVADFIRQNIPLDSEQLKVERALDIVEAPWPGRDEGRLRKWFATELKGMQKTSYLINKILASGLEPFVAPEPLPPISKEDIKLLVWMGITSSS